MDNLEGVSAFVAVVEAQGFSEAARRLGLSKGAVSKQIARLEERLGARLINRTTRRLSLTEIGVAYFERCQRIVMEAEDAELAVGRLQTQPTGTLRVNAPMSFGIAHVAPLLSEFLGNNSGLSLDLTLNDRYVDLVDEGFDLAIRIGALDDSSLIARKLVTMRRLLVASPDYLARAGRPVTVSDIPQHDGLCYAYQQSGETWRFQDGTATRTLTIRGRLRANNGDALKVAAVSGLGLALLPSFIVAPEIAAGALEVVELDLPPAGLDIHAVYPSSRHLSAKVRAFVDFIAIRFGPIPPWEAALSAPRAARPA